MSEKKEKWGKVEKRSFKAFFILFKSLSLFQCQATMIIPMPRIACVAKEKLFNMKERNPGREGGQVILRLGRVGWNITAITHRPPLAGLNLLSMAKF